MQTKAEHDRLSGYFNIDNGTGRIRGVYLQGNEMMRPIFEAWFAALKDMTEGVVTIRNTTGTDHQSFDAVGLPGFQFIQDPMDYETRSHHSNMDVYEPHPGRPTWSRWRSSRRPSYTKRRHAPRETPRKALPGKPSGRRPRQLSRRGRHARPLTDSAPPWVAPKVKPLHRGGPHT